MTVAIILTIDTLFFISVRISANEHMQQLDNIMEQRNVLREEVSAVTDGSLAIFSGTSPIQLLNCTRCMKV